MAGWLGPSRRIAGVRHDAARALRAVSTSYTLEAAEKLRTFDKPVLLAWAPDDKYFPFEHAERLAALLPNARMERINDAYTFVSEDQPERLATLVRDFIASLPVKTPAGGAT
jgi:pimeloyl-ACP methyl ester carboxylesterase